VLGFVTFGYCGFEAFMLNKTIIVWILGLGPSDPLILSVNYDI
jgi:hypothetical protein